MLAQLSTFVRYAATLPGYLRHTMTAQEAESRLRDALTNRDSNFLRILERGIYGQASSPYLALLKGARVSFADVEHMVRLEGLETTLGKLYDAGVYLTLDEFKGRRPIDRPGVHIPPSPRLFDNPLSIAHYQGKSSGSRGPRTRVNIDLAMLEHEAAYVRQYLDAFQLWNRPYAVWRPVPPVVTALKWQLRLEKVGKPLDRWFSQTRHDLQPANWKFGLFTLTTVAGGRALGRPFPLPRHVTTDAPGAVARWLMDMKRAGTPAVVDTIVSSAVRLCLDARARGFDISGTLFRLGGEPLTPAKAKVFSDAGCQALCFYSITEMSFVAAPCATPDAPDDVHLLTDKLAALVRPKRGAFGSVDALIYTTLLPSSPKLMLNVESGDYATLTTRACGCPMGRLGFTRHLQDIRSYEKLTSEGVTFLGTELLRLVEEVLPQRFGGAPTDYQIVEAEEGELSRIFVVASPALGPLDEGAVVEVVLQILSAYPGGSAMTEHWRQGGTLKVLRREPYRTESAKVLPLHLQRLTPPAARARE